MKFFKLDLNTSLICRNLNSKSIQTPSSENDYALSFRTFTSQLRSMNSAGKNYRVAGEHRYDGILYLPSCPDYVVKKVRDEKLDFQRDDVIVATYPKSGT